MAMTIRMATNRSSKLHAGFASVSFAKNASAGIVLSGRTFVTVMQAAEVRNRDDRSDTQDPAKMRTLLVES